MPASQRRAQLLEVAREAFARGGYRGTTALEVGREAGVSEKLVLKHFGTKEGLFRAAVLDPLIELWKRENEAARQRLDAGARDTPQQAFERVHAFLSIWARHVREQGPLLVSCLAELREFPDEAGQLLALVNEQIDQAVEILTGAEDSDGLFRPFDVRVSIQAALGAATVAAVVAEDPEAFIDEYLKLTLFGVLTETGRQQFRLADR
jgi:AcrR family transcriptional regulator